MRKIASANKSGIFVNHSWDDRSTVRGFHMPIMLLHNKKHDYSQEYKYIFH